MDDILRLVDTERLYSHVLKTEGVKHPIDSLDELDACADYILDQFRDMGLKTNEQEFTVKNFDHTFRNIEAWTGDGTGPQLLIVSHYDTVSVAPGANDNGSAITVMLETAQVLAESGFDGRVRFISFNLEELNPGLAAKDREFALQYDIIDDQGRYNTWHTTKMMKQVWKIYMQVYRGGSSRADAIRVAIENLQDDLTENEVKYLNSIAKLNEGIMPTDWPGKTAVMGSSRWVEYAQRENIKVSGVLCLETMGYASKEYRQNFPKGLDPDMFKIYRTQEDLTVGDFLSIVGDKNSGPLAESFCEQCQTESINLPYACLQEDFNYEQAAHIMPDLLRSDHAPFWRVGIPALMLTDSANFRYPFYHTRADTIDKLDFDFLAKITKATIATALNYH